MVLFHVSHFLIKHLIVYRNSRGCPIWTGHGFFAATAQGTKQNKTIPFKPTRAFNMSLKFTIMEQSMEQSLEHSCAIFVGSCHFVEVHWYMWNLSGFHGACQQTRCFGLKDPYQLTTCNNQNMRTQWIPHWLKHRETDISLCTAAPCYKLQVQED